MLTIGSSKTETYGLRFLLSAVATVVIAVAILSSVRPASADGCDIDADSCGSLDSLAQLRADIATYVPAPWQRSFNARLDAVERRLVGLEAGDNASGIFAIMMSYMKMANAEHREDRKNARHDWRSAFLPALAADVEAVVADVCAIVNCSESDD